MSTWSRWVLALVLASALAAEPATAQVAGEGLDLRTLPIDGRNLAVGQRATGRLTDGDRAWDDDSRIQAWRLLVDAGATVTVNLVSPDFDAFLIVVGPGLDEPLTDDDGAGACHARLTWTADEAGAFIVVVNSIGSHAGGNFTLSVGTEPGPVARGSCIGPETAELGFAEWPVDDRMIAVGGQVTGSLTTSDSLTPDASYAQAWGVRLAAQQRVTVDLIADDFDPFLWVAGPQMEVPLGDDDGGGACYARVSFTAPAGGIYRLVANTLMPARTGSFTLRVSATPPLPAEGACGDGAEWRMDLSLLPVGQRRLTPVAEVSGTLTMADTLAPDGSYLQAWGLELRAGDTVTVDLIATEFDAFLWIAGPGIEEPITDDDGAGRCDARITFTAPTDGLYRVIVNTSQVDMTGAFRLRIAREPGPVTPGTCEA